MFIAIFQSVRKDEKRKKNEEIKTKFWPLIYLGNGRAIFLKFGMWGDLPGRHLCSETSFNQMRDHGAIKV